MSTPRIALCTAVKGRLQHLRQTLPANIANNSDYDNCVFVVLDYGSQDGLLSYLKSNHAADLANGRLIAYHMDAHGPFKMAHSKNGAARCGLREGAQIICTLDADNYTGPGFARYIADQFERNGRESFLWAQMIQKCNHEDVCILPRFHPGAHSASVLELEARYAPEDRPLVRGITGRIALTADAFLKVGGYDEKYSDYGPDDKDITMRLQKLGYTPHRIPRRFLEAIHHGAKLRFKEYPHAADIVDCTAVRCVPEQDTAVVNFGHFGCGHLENIGTGEAVELAPVPTRILGIGFHRTRTTSLSAALKILGYDSWHWETPRWARDIWMEMRTAGKSLTLERHYALSDFPITLLYRELDRGYPGSKFILTIRDEAEWLRSVELHWSYDHNKWRADWDWDCFTHRLHQEIYGRKTFDPDVFLARYRRHNAEVREYFRERPNDLLVMDRPEWGPLCAFLGKPIQLLAYPRENRTIFDPRALGPRPPQS